LAYSGSSVIRGEATGIVTATGTKTYFGKTISLLDFAAHKLHMEELRLKLQGGLPMWSLYCWSFSLHMQRFLV
jgi:magnesium-transporting ATPase (P-type)